MRVYYVQWICLLLWKDKKHFGADKQCNLVKKIHLQTLLSLIFFAAIEKKRAVIYREKSFLQWWKNKADGRKNNNFFPHYVRNYWTEKTGFYPLFQCKKKVKKHVFKLHMIYKKNNHSGNICFFFLFFCQGNKVKKRLNGNKKLLFSDHIFHYKKYCQLGKNTAFQTKNKLNDNSVSRNGRNNR